VLACSGTSNPDAPVRAQQTVPVLGIENDHFTVDGVQKFLLFISYFDAIRADPADLERDFKFIKSNGFDGIRVFPNWWKQYGCGGAGYADDGLFTSASDLNTDRGKQFLNVLDEAAANGLLVDVTFTRGTIDRNWDDPNADIGITVAEYQAQIVAVTRLLNNAYPHVLFDVENEYDDNGTGLTDEEVKQIRDAIKKTDARRLVTISTAGGNDLEAGEIARSANLDIVASHPSRSGNWWAEEIVSAIDAGRDGQKGPPYRPIYLQEPNAFDVFDGKDPRCAKQIHDILVARHLEAAENAKRNGAAAYTFHTRTTFDLSGGKGYLDQLASRPDERKAIESLRKVRN
jgi:hypothetical protein